MKTWKKNLNLSLNQETKDVSEEVTKTTTETSNYNNRALENLNNKLLEIMNDRGISATCLMSPRSKGTNPENTSQFKLVKDFGSNRVNDLLVKKAIPITFNDNLLSFRDTGKVFELKRDLWKMITNKNYNVDIASLLDKKVMYDFATELNFDVKTQGNKSSRGRTLINFFKSSGLLVSASGISETNFLPSNPKELCDRLTILLQENTMVIILT